MPIEYVPFVDRRPALSHDSEPDGQRENDFCLPIIVSHPDAPVSDVLRMAPQSWALDTCLAGYGITSPEYLLRHFKLIAVNPATRPVLPGEPNRLEYFDSVRVKTEGVGEAKVDGYTVNLWLAPHTHNESGRLHLLGTVPLLVQPSRRRNLIGRNTLIEAGLQVILDCPAPDDIDAVPTICVSVPRMIT